MPFSRPGSNDVIQAGANGQRFGRIDSIKESVTGEMFDNEFNYTIKALNDLEVQIANVVAGAIPGTEDPGNKDKALITDGGGNIGLSFIDSQNIAEKGVEESNLGDFCVSNRTLQKGIVTGENVADNTLPTRVYGTESVTGDKVAPETIDYKHLKKGAGKEDFFANKGIPSEAYGDLSIPRRAIQLRAIGRDQLSADVTAGLSNTYGPIGHYLEVAYEAPAPYGYFDCDNGLMLRSAYPELFALLGTKYGGSGLYFRRPDARGRTRVCIAPGTAESGGPLGGRVTLATASNLNLGGTGGSETHRLTLSEMPSHNHIFEAPAQLLANRQLPGDGTDAVPIGGPVDGETNSRGADVPHNNMMPFLFTRLLIRAI